MNLQMEVDEPDGEADVVHRLGESDNLGLNFVQPRNEEERAVVSVRQADRIHAPDDLVGLASQITTARGLVKERACDRLKQIADQMEHLHLAAKKVLEDASRDEDLHSVPCNMQKHPGRVYHLYRRADGYRYFSLLAPEEWQKTEKHEEFVGSFRLEYDQSWTPLADAEHRDRQFARFVGLLSDNSAMKPGPGPSMLGWRN